MKYTQKTAQLRVIKSFVDKWKIRTSAKDILFLTYSANFFPTDANGKSLKTSLDTIWTIADEFRSKGDSFDSLFYFNIFSDVDFKGSQIVKSSSEIHTKEKFDLIIGALPFRMNKVSVGFQDVKFKIYQNWNEILLSLELLENDGTGLYLLEPLGFNSIIGKKFENVLNHNGFYINCYFNAPEKILLPETSITPIIVVITKKPSAKLFIGELLNENQAEQIVDNYFSSKSDLDLKTGKYIDSESYYGFHQLKIKQQIERLETQYKNYTKHTLGDLAIEINYAKSGGEFQERDNAIYIPKIGKSPVVSTLRVLSFLSTKPQYAAQYLLVS